MWGHHWYHQDKLRPLGKSNLPCFEENLWCSVLSNWHDLNTERDFRDWPNLGDCFDDVFSDVGGAISTKGYTILRVSRQWRHERSAGLHLSLCFWPWMQCDHQPQAPATVASLRWQVAVWNHERNKTFLLWVAFLGLFYHSNRQSS